jgi:hypothetical protein
MRLDLFSSYMLLYNLDNAKHPPGIGSPDPPPRAYDNVSFLKKKQTCAPTRSSSSCRPFSRPVNSTVNFFLIFLKNTNLA